MNKLIFFFFILTHLICHGQKEEPTKIFIQKVNSLLIEKYVYPEKGKQITQELLGNYNSGNYKKLSKDELIEKMNLDIHAFHPDLHIQLVKQNNLAINWNRGPITSLQILEGNIGYFNIRSFPTPTEDVYHEIALAFDFLRSTKGLIIDLRDNGGGHPDVVSEILGYLVEKEVTYDVFYVPSNDKSYEYKTHKKIKGNKLLSMPTAVLINENTASSGEIFALAIQNLKLGKIYGQLSKGLVNLAEYYPLGNGYYLLLSKGEQRNPFLKGSIENKGIQPDVVTNEPLYQAHLDIIHSTYSASTNSWLKKGLSKKQLGNEAVFKDLVGWYGFNQIILSKGKLFYCPPSGFTYQLIPIEENTFKIKSNNKVSFRLTFVKAQSGWQMNKIYFNGEKESYTKREANNAQK